MTLAINSSSLPASRCLWHPQSHVFFRALRYSSSAEVCLSLGVIRTMGVSPFPRRFSGRVFLPGGRLVGGGAAPSQGGRRVAIPHSHASSTWHVTTAGYSCLIGTYVPQG